MLSPFCFLQMKRNGLKIIAIVWWTITTTYASKPDKKNWSESSIWPTTWSCAMIFNHSIGFQNVYACISIDCISFAKQIPKEFLLFLRWISFLFFVCGFAIFFFCFSSFSFPISLSFFGSSLCIAHLVAALNYTVNESKTSAVILLLFFLFQSRRKKRDYEIQCLTKKDKKKKRQRYTCFIQIYIKRFPIQFFSAFFLAVDQDRFSMLWWTLSNWPYATSFRQF